MKNEFKRSKIQFCPVCSSKKIENSFINFDDRYGQPDLFTLAKCKKCSAYYLLDPVSSTDIGKLYKKYYPSLNIPPGQGSKIQKILSVAKPLLHLVKKIDATETLISRVKNDSSVLDVGCGYYPRLKNEIDDKNLDWEGLEIDEKLVKTINSAGLVCHQGSLASFRSSKKYDYILMSQVIEHQLQLKEAMEKVAKLLKKGGKCLILTPNTDNLSIINDVKSWIHWHTPYHTVLFNLKSMSVLAGINKFKINTYKTYTPTNWELLTRNFRSPIRGQKNKSFHYKFSPLEYFLVSLSLRIRDLQKPSCNPCMFCELEKR